MGRKTTNRLRVLRAERGITQMDLAKKAGLGLTRYWRIENGYDEPAANELRALAKVLRTGLNDLGFAVLQEQAS